FRRVRALKRAMELDLGREEVATVIVFLENYVVEHFTAEEAFMKGLKYPELNPHKVEHASFVREFEIFKREFDEKGSSEPFAVKTHDWLKDWLTGHIGKTDRALGLYLRTKP
ncbi:MAG: hemerythrin family protein, partial [Thermodesulfobacteriota bacterium]